MLFWLVLFRLFTTRWQCSPAPAALPLRRDHLTYISKHTGRDGGGVFLNATDFRSSTYLFICLLEETPALEGFFCGWVGTNNWQ